ncbi:MAG TPA: nucleotidyltransferase family protein [Thermoanaerobaculia bacterium]|nr:nucleotidyltransferase family protein [Thermoanaerobaculia bacterium]
MPAEPAARICPVGGILLAAGTSSRMGSNKLLFELEGESLLRRAVRRALAGGLDPLVVVLGHQAGRAAEELQGLACQVVVNPDYERGITSSLHAGLAALPARVQAAMVLLADMPLVGAEMIAQLIARYRATEAPLVISDYEGVNAPPMLYDRALFGELRTMQGGGCGRQVVKRHRGQAEVMPWPAAALSDLDVPEDYARITGGFGGGAR